ncbi:protein toll-like [Phymastichus coffea]|uniref:protein toll-like n=1 Tax=Phymastichus coffea TaxID=108790 RepID=UPI00273C9042|nr:protein toll-like [Phymastichus coffea]
MNLLGLSILLSGIYAVSASAFACPANLPCHCMDSDDGEDKHLVHCVTSDRDGSAIDLTVQSGSSLRVQCVNSPHWSDFLAGVSLRVGNASSFSYAGCRLPGARHSQELVARLGVTGVESLKIEKLRGNVSRADLEVFPQARRLVLTGNELGEVPVDLLHGLPNLIQLELRGTRLKLPATGFFERARALVSLELSQNDLHELRPGAFAGLDSLELLNAWSSNISALQRDSFRGLSSLLSLDVKMNRLRALPADVFHELPNLKVINFGMNNFSELPAELFSRNRNLTVVKLMYNRVNISRLPDRLLADQRQLRTVSLERMGLLSVPENLIWGSDAIVELNMNRNYLATLPANLLKDARQLHRLSFSFNDLQFIPDRAFSQLNRLHFLDLSRNHLRSINERLFHGLDALRELNIEQNDLQHIAVDAFVSLAALRVAKFSRNRLTLRTDTFDMFGQLSPFHGCQSLEELCLSHNNISEIYGDWTVSHVKLRKLDLSYNSLEYLQTEDLQFVSSKLQVDLTHNAISTIDLTRLEHIAAEQHDSRQVTVNLNSNPIYCDCQLYSLLRYTNGELKPAALDFVTLQVQHLACDGPEHMRGTRLLSLKTPELKCILDRDGQSTAASGDPCSANGACDCWLRPVDRTLILDCAARNLTEAPALIVLGNADYVEIDLSANALTLAPSLLGNGYDKVRSLNLAGNLIGRLDEDLISPNLKVLRLDGNRLSHIDDQLLDRIARGSNISLLTLHDNPWGCDCEALALLNFAQNNYRLLPERHNVSCSATNRTLSDLQPADLCPRPVQLIVSTSLATALLALLLAVGLALLFYYQQQVKVYLYSKNLCLWLVTEEELDKDKIWDAFVSYSHEDEQFVVGELVGKLESGPRPYKLCIHGRDWLAGDWIPSNIQRSVEGSRRTIIVLSRHFVDSEWGKLEFQAAHKRALRDKCARLIVVLYGDVDPARIQDQELRHYLQMNTYIKWGDPWFYEKIRYALPHKHASAKH